MSNAPLTAEQIYIEYHPKVLAYITSRINNAYEAEDLAQTVFLKVYAKYEGFDSTQSSISTWIYNITKNTLIDFYRRREKNSYDEIPETLAGDDDDPSLDLIMEEQQELLANALSELSTFERDVIIMRYYNEKTLLAISAEMNIPYGQIKRIHAKALQKLAKSMGAA